MTRRVQVILQDDIDGGEPAQTIYFAVDGKNYEIDLTEPHAAELRDCLAPWIAAARRASTAPIPKPRSKPNRASDTVDIRRWAKENNIPVSERGRTVVGGKRLVQLGHLAADAGQFLHQVDFDSHIGQVQGCLDSGNAAADNQYVFAHNPCPLYNRFAILYNASLPLQTISCEFCQSINLFSGNRLPDHTDL